MNYSVEEIESQLRSHEDSVWEFKQVGFSRNVPREPSRSSWADEIAAFANAAGGVVLASVTDTGEVIGMSRAQIANLDAHLVEVSTDTIKPPVRIRTHHKELSGGKLVLLVEVPESDAVHDSPGGTYTRVGASKRLMGGDERLRLAQRRSQARYMWFDKQTVPGTGFKTLSEALWKPLLSAEGAADPEAALGKLALLEEDEAGVPRATVAGVLLCTRNPQQWLPSACITATRYRGGDRASGQIDAREITGPLNEQVAGAVAFAARNMQVAARKDPARSDLPQYSEKALFEALVNAVVHRDYSIRGSKIRLSMFDDRLEIQSPGSLPNNLSVESMAPAASDSQRSPDFDPGADAGGRDPGQRGQALLHGAPRRRCPDHPPRNASAVREVSRIPGHRRLGSPAGHSRCCAGTEPRPRHCLRAVRRPAFTGRRCAAAVSEQDLEARIHGRGRRGAGRSAHHPTAHDGVRGGGRPCRLSGAGLDGCRANGRSPSISMPCPKAGASFSTRKGAGHLPGLKGRLNPKRDVHDRTYLHASNIAINEGEQQPVHFLPGEQLRLTDAEGTDWACGSSISSAVRRLSSIFRCRAGWECDDAPDPAPERSSTPAA